MKTKFVAHALKFMCATSVLAMPQPVLAQAQDVQQTSGTALEEVVVTAQKRAENLQDVPISVAAVTGESIENLHAVSLKEVAVAFPGIRMSSFANQPTSAIFNIRGIGIVEPDAFAGNTVSIVVDGVPQFFNYGALLDLYDVDRIEVLKGPQGTLFGANTTGGVVNVITAQPTGEFDAKAEATYGNHDRIDLGAAINFPVTENLAAKIVAFQTEHDGWVENIEDPDTPLGRRERSILRAYLKYKGGERFDATLIGEYDRGRDGGSYIVNGASPGDSEVPPGTLPVPGAEFIFVPAGDRGMYSSVCPPDTQQFCDPPDRFIASRDKELPDVNDLDNYRLTFTMDFRDTGIGDITAITGYKDYDWLEFLDTDGTPYVIARGRNHSEGWQFSQEVRTNANLSDSLNLVAGAFYIDSYYETDRQGMFYGCKTDPCTSGGFLSQTAHEQDNYSISGFAQAYWDIAARLQLLAGFRYTYERTSLTAKTQDSFAPDGDPDQNAPFYGTADGYDTTVPPGNLILPSSIAPVSGEKSWQNEGWKLGLNFKPTEDVLLYASWSSGFKSGGFTGRIGTPQDIGPFEPEYVDTYEVGAKADWLDRSLRTNLAVFYSDYTDMQLAQSYIFEDPDTGLNRNGTTIINASDARIYGAELELAFVPVEGLTLGAGLAYLDAKYSDFPYLQASLDADPVTPDVQPLTLDLSGVTLMNAPEWSYTLNAAIDFALGAGRATARLDYAYTGEQYQNIEPHPRSRIDSIGLIGASFDWTPAQGAWSVSLWGRNLADEHYFASAFSQPGFGAIYGWGMEREYGATVRFRW